MKTHYRSLIALLGLVALLPAGRCAEKNDPPAPAKSEQPGMRVFVNHPPKDLPKEPVTFLGVETMPASPTLVSQLGLAEGTGLVITNVVPDSPAAGVLKEHDILVKLDDQLLIEVRQLAVLVRNHQEGDEITLVYLRGGQQQTAKVKLAKREMPKLSMHLPFEGRNSDRLFGRVTGSAGSGGGHIELMRGEEMGGPGPVDARMMDLLQSAPPQSSVRIIERQGGPTPRVTMLNPGKSEMMFSDEAGTLELKIDDGQKELTAKDAKGAVIFAGPINTPEERKALPESVRPRLEKILRMQGFSFTPDGDFHPGPPVVQPQPGRQI
ncbi:MAG TPA: PDZ domain-containing protein [Opitutaceae bacterium]|nr:PDZ domain-containing protein [Opitutaceae bacterium]